MVITIHTAGAAAAQHAVVLVLFPEPVAQAQSICANQLLGRKQLQLRCAAAVQLRRRWPSSRAPDESAGATNHNARVFIEGIACFVYRQFICCMAATGCGAWAALLVCSQAVQPLPHT